MSRDKASADVFVDRPPMDLALPAELEEARFAFG
jgi:hypothetical protein